LPKSAPGMTGAESDKMPRPRGRRELSTMQVVKQLSRGQSWLPDWTREVSAKMNSYQNRRLCLGGRINQAATGMWSLINQAATKIWGRDRQELVSSLVLAVDGADEQDNYLCPWSILRREGAGRSWEIKTPQIFLGWSENR
jgi:hypothetical protein